jgi:monoamine oxidase
MARTSLVRMLQRAYALSVRPDPQERRDRGIGRSERGVTRREVLAGGLAAAAGIALTGIPGRTARAAAWRDDEEPVAILGGGLAGLTAAYRLSRAGIRCQVFEASRRWGGRVFTQVPFNAEGMFCELGGELIDSDHTDLLALAAELQLPIDVLTEGDRIARELFFVDGRLRGETEILGAFGPLAGPLARDIARLSPGGELVMPTYNRTLGVEDLDRISLAAYLDRLRGQVEGWLLRLVETAYVGEYGLEADSQSALNLLTLIDPGTTQGFRILGNSDESRRIRGGNGKLVAALVEAVRGRVDLRPGYRLRAIRDTGTRLRLVFETDGGTREVQARRALIAMPFSTLREVDGIFRLDLSPVKRRAIAGLAYGTNAKLMLGFKARFWRDSSGGIPASSGSLYSDLGSQEFWETSRRQEGHSGILTSFVGGHAGEKTFPDRVEQALHDLDRVYGGATGPDRAGRARRDLSSAAAGPASALWDGRHAQMVWRLQPLSRGSYTCLGPGQYTTVFGAGGEPELSGRLAFAGEHCSVDSQGYMNGAIESAQSAIEAWTSAKARVYR